MRNAQSATRSSVSVDCSQPETRGECLGESRLKARKSIGGFDVAKQLYGRPVPGHWMEVPSAQSHLDSRPVADYLDLQKCY